MAWKLAQSPTLSKLYAAPGNPGIAGDAELVALDIGNHAAILEFCLSQTIDLVVVGPEQPLVEGIADTLSAAGISVFGPSKAAAQLEGSKGFVKDLCARENIPTAAYQRFSDKNAALAGLSQFGLPVVIKADGLAAGKGVIIAETGDQATAAIEDMFSGSFGSAGAEIVVEEFMTGEEASFFALTDGDTVTPFGSAQDHKRVGDGDIGPNTGGMGAYSPASVLTPELEQRAMDEIVLPTVRAMKAADTPYSGVLYAGLILTAEGPKLIEYNCRFGDPECQVLMMRFDGDLLQLLLAVAEGRLKDAGPVRLADRAALTVVMAAKGYPGTPEKGSRITGLAEAEKDGAIVFHAGTAASGTDIVANGGRVLNVTAADQTIAAAREAAYRAVDLIDFPGGFCRRDIGWRELSRTRND